MISCEITIINRLGLHARAATRLVTCASQHQSEIWVEKDDKRVNGKSIMGILTLAASKGTVLTIQAQGEDAIQALESLCELITDRFGEDE
jgi:phosphocarrier protein